MTSQSSSSSLAKQRQSWLDLVSQASPPSACGETAVVCSAQVHSHQPPQEETEEVDVSHYLAGSSQHESLEGESNEGSSAAEEEEVQRAVCGAHEDEGETFPLFYCAFHLGRTFKVKPSL